MSYSVIDNRKIKIAIVGCGRISVNHFDALKKIQDQFELVGVSDVNAELLNKVITDQKVPGYSTLSELITHTQPDVVTLCTPSGMHPQQTIEISSYGKHVITEKPMAVRWEEGLAMVQACEKVGVRLFVVKQNRLNPTVQVLKQAIESGRFGQLYVLQANVLWTRPQQYYDQAKWRGTSAWDGGALMNQASHYVDLIQWLGGPLQYVQAISGTLARQIETEDTITLNLKWRSGAIGSMLVSMLTYPKNLEGSITVLGEKGTVRLGGVALNRIEVWDFSDSQSPTQAEVQKLNYDPVNVYGSGHTLYYENVAQTLRGKSKALVDGEAGLKSLELMIAAYRAAKTKSTVLLPLER